MAQRFAVRHGASDGTGHARDQPRTCPSVTGLARTREAPPAWCAEKSRLRCAIAPVVVDAQSTGVHVASGS
jgi:hypothetical protein